MSDWETVETALAHAPPTTEIRRALLAVARRRTREQELEEALRDVMPESHHPTCAVYLPQNECDCGYGVAHDALEPRAEA